MPRLNSVPHNNSAFVSPFIHAWPQTGLCCCTLLLSVTSCSFPALLYLISLHLGFKVSPAFSLLCILPRAELPHLPSSWAGGCGRDLLGLCPAVGSLWVGWAQPGLLPRTAPAHTLKPATAARLFSCAQQNKPGCLGHRFDWFFLSFPLLQKSAWSMLFHNLQCKLYWSNPWLKIDSSKQHQGRQYLCPATHGECHVTTSSQLSSSIRRGEEGGVGRRTHTAEASAGAGNWCCVFIRLH